jgi:iron(II)-dependent oxidoreductase
VILLLLACTQPGDSGDTSDTAPPLEDDADGDGFLRWDAATDPALADCDDDDPTVTPATERLIPGGTFVRGETALEWNFLLDTEPVRDIDLSPYCVDVFEVTNAEFVDFMEAQRDAGSTNQDAQGRPLFDFEDDDDTVPERILDETPYGIQDGYADHPVTEVWHWSGEAYCGGQGQRLPTEAEWEKAARGDQDARTWPWGDTAPTCDTANIRPGDEGAEGPEPCLDDTTPVGDWPDNVSPYGLTDMVGNVAEWVHDWYQPDYYEPSDDSPDTDPQGPSEGFVLTAPDGGDMVIRVSRGGSFASSLDSTRVSSRYLEPAEGTSNGVGFRCARSL